MQTRFQNSVCGQGFLHRWKQISPTKSGFLERCERCGKQMNFQSNLPNHVYLSYHIRELLQPNDPMFKKEYPNVKI